LIFLLTLNLSHS